MKKRGVTYGPPEPELILSAAVIGAKGERKSEKKRSPIKGGRSAVSDPKAVTDKTKKHKKVSFTTSRAEIPYNSGTSRMVEGRKYQVGEAIEIDLPNRLIDGVRCVILELWETEESVPYAKLKPLMNRDVTKEMLKMLTTVGVRVQDIKLMECVQEIFETDVDTTAIIDSGATRTIVPDESYLVEGSIYELERPVQFRGFDKNGTAQTALWA